MQNHESILRKRLNGERLTLEDGVRLYSCDLLALGQAAQKLTKRLLKHQYLQKEEVEKVKERKVKRELIQK